MQLKRWSLARCQNVNHVYSLFKERGKVEKLDDGKEYSLTLMRADDFTALVRMAETSVSRYDLVKAFVEALPEGKVEVSALKKLIKEIETISQGNRNGPSDENTSK